MPQPDRSKPPEFGKDPAEVSEQIPARTNIPSPTPGTRGLNILVICTGSVWKEKYKSISEKSNDSWTWVSPVDRDSDSIMSKLAGRVPDVVVLHCQESMLLHNPILYRIRQVLTDAKWFQQKAL